MGRRRVEPATLDQRAPNSRGVETRTIVAGPNQHSMPAALYGDVDEAGLGLARTPPSCRVFDAVSHAVAHDVHQCFVQRRQYVRVDMGFGSRMREPHLLVERPRRVSDDPFQIAHEHVSWH